jgi:hypothetical protein
MAIGLTTVLLFLLGYAGTIRNVKMVKEAKTPSQEAFVAKVAAEEPDTEISLTLEDKEFLNSLTERFDSGDLEGAARLLSGYEIPWKEFPCMYDGTVMRKELSSAKGLVFSKTSTVFYGEFKDGVPNGTCTALQVISLEEGKRYDYSYGTWANGMMNGNGASGYNYYDGVTDDINKLSAKEGVFKDNRMEGEVTYSSTNAAGENAAWKFTVADGRIVLDDRWIKAVDGSGATTYKLMANDEKNHAYTLTEADLQEDRWKNFIEFDIY